MLGLLGSYEALELSVCESSRSTVPLPEATFDESKTKDLH